jgi:type IV pilus assembly protein PilC
MFTQQLASLLVAGLPLVQCARGVAGPDRGPMLPDRDPRRAQRHLLRQFVFGRGEKIPPQPSRRFHLDGRGGRGLGRLAEILGKVAGYFESTVKLTKKVKSAMTYPIAVIGLAIALVNVLLIFVIPVFAAMFADFGAKLPAPTQMLIDLSNFMKATGGGRSALGAYGISTFRAFSKFVATPNGRRQKDRFLVKAPIFGNLVHKIALSRFCRTYATLIRSGVPILRTLEIVASASGKVQIEDACVEIAKHVSQGGQVSEVWPPTSFSRR